MKKNVVGGAASSLLLIALAGCGPELAQTQLGSEEEQWQSQIRSSYSSWRPPRVAPPATFDNRDPDFKPAPADEAQAPKAGDAEKAAADPSAVPDAAVDTVGIPGESAPAEGAPAAVPAKASGKTQVQTSAVQQPGEVYVVQKGDSISRIAQKFYGDGRRYMPILKANDAQFKGNPNRIYPGMKLVIPKL